MLNFASIAGFILCFVVILTGIATNGGIGEILTFVHGPSMLVTFGGSFLAVLASADSFEDYIAGLKGFAEALKKPVVSVEAVAGEVFEMSGIARKEGLLALEEHANAINDEFLKRGIRLVVDGTDPELVKNILEMEMIHREEESMKKIHFWEDLGAMAPAWGMVGTLLGLINMMKSMGADVGNIGSGMALALITTLYGSVLANWVCSPIVRKMKKNNETEMMVMEVAIEGVLSVQAGENPQIIREKMGTFLKEKLEMA